MRFLLILILFINISNYGFAKTIRLASLSWKPYIANDLPQQGIIAQIVRHAFESQGWKLEIVFLPWARALMETKQGNFDGIFPEYHDEGRLKHFIFSNPFFQGEVGFYKRKNSPIKFDGNLNSLKKYRIGVVQDYVNTKELDNTKDFKKHITISDLSNLKKLWAKRVDLIFIDKLVAKFLVENAPSLKGAKDKLEFLLPIVENKDFYIAFAKNAPNVQEKIKVFNLGLKSIKSKIPKIINSQKY